MTFTCNRICASLSVTTGVGPDCQSENLIFDQEAQRIVEDFEARDVSYYR